MSLVKVQGNASGTGIFTIASPNSNTDRTLTLPDNTGTILTTATAGVPVNGPAFSAYRSANQTVSNNTTTKVQLTLEDFDTANCFDSTTNYRFTPTVAGYYMFTFAVYGITSTNNLELNFAQLYKNGAAVEPSTARAGSYTYTPANQYVDGTAGASVLVYMNGSTDYVELYGRLVGGGTLNIAQASLQAFLARSAT